jgi:hypothetical protein
MKVLYAARCARFDFLRAVCVLARHITRWDAQCDRQLYRLMCYINSAYHMRMTGWIGDTADDLCPHLSADADFAGGAGQSRSTSGIYLALQGTNSCFPLAAQSQKQGIVSHSTPVAEIVAASHAMRVCGLPPMDMWDSLLGRKVVLRCHEDDGMAILAMKTGIAQRRDTSSAHTEYAFGGSWRGSLTLHIS